MFGQANKAIKFDCLAGQKINQKVRSGRWSRRSRRRRQPEDGRTKVYLL